MIELKEVFDMYYNGNDGQKLAAEYALVQLKLDKLNDYIDSKKTYSRDDFVLVEQRNSLIDYYATLMGQFSTMFKDMGYGVGDGMIEINDWIKGRKPLTIFDKDEE